MPDDLSNMNPLEYLEYLIEVSVGEGQGNDAKDDELRQIVASHVAKGNPGDHT